MALYVNGERIENAEIDEERRIMRRLLAEQMPEESPRVIEERAREWAPDNLIERVLLKQAALNDPEPLSADNPEAELQLRIERLVTRVTSRAAKPRRKDIVEYFMKNQAQYQSEESIHAAHIVRNVDENCTEATAKEEIEQALVRLQADEPFENVAQELSSCPGRGGDLGFFARGQMVDEFDEVAFATKPGSISDIFRTPFGFHIVKVISRREAGPLSLEEVAGSIEEVLFAQKKQKLLDQHLDSLRAKADIREVD